MVTKIVFSFVLWISLFFYGFYLHKTALFRENDIAKFPLFIKKLFRERNITLSIRGLATQFLSFWFPSYLLIEFNIVSLETWTTIALISFFLLMGLLIILGNWGRWFEKGLK